MLVILSVSLLCAGVFLFGKYPVVYHVVDVIFASLTVGGAVTIAFVHRYLASG